MLDWLNQIDTELFLAINECHNSFFDSLMTVLTSKLIWIPFYLSLLLVILKKYKHQGWWILFFLILVIVLCDQSSGFMKDTIQRFRPTHQPLLADKIHAPLKKGGLYGFVSSHAANAFGLAVFTSALFKNRLYSIALILWAILIAYTRAYLGLHYPFDLLGGAILGSLIAWLLYFLLKKLDTQRLLRQIEKQGAMNGVELKPVWTTLLFTFMIMILVIMVI